MEQYCITLEQAKDLQGRSFFRKSQWFWIRYGNDEYMLTDYSSIINDAFIKYPAYHVGELGEILKDWVHDIDYESEVRDYPWEITNLDVAVRLHPTEAQARGELLIYLLKKHRI